MAHHDLWGRPSPETDEEYLEYYQDRISLTQSRQLLPLQEDLADWINKTLGIEYMNATNLLDMLDNGVILCHLAKLIQNRIQEAVDDGTEPGPVPIMKGRCFENAARRSFFSRDNMDRFIQFCRQLGVHQNLLFESEDLVLQNNPRSVILCLMEVARLASRYNIEPPGLVALEKEIAEEESHDSGLSLVSWQFQGTGTISKPSRHSGSDSRRGLGDSGAGGDDGGLVGAGGASDGVPSDTTEDDWSRGSGEDPDLLDITDHSGIINTPARGDAGMSDLDRKVQHATRAAQRHCHCRADKCDKLRVKKVGEGRYNIAGRNVFVRLLKGRHMMVRVGGGWDTLDHFLQRHDPCQIKAVSRPVSPTNGSTALLMPRPLATPNRQHFPQATPTKPLVTPLATPTRQLATPKRPQATPTTKIPRHRAMSATPSSCYSALRSTNYRSSTPDTVGR